MTDTVPVDQLKDVIREEAEATAKIKQYEGVVARWKAHRETLRQRIAFALQGREGTVDGVAIVAATPTARFAHARFAQDHPDHARLFMRPTTTEELDVAALVAAEPDLTRDYFVTAFTNRTVL